jgi:hypothetical protein
VPLGSTSSSLPCRCVRNGKFRLRRTLQIFPYELRSGTLRGFTYIWNPTTQDTETIYSAARTASTEIITRVGLADVCRHRAQKVRIAVIRRSEIEVVDSRWVCGDTLIVKLG